MQTNEAQFEKIMQAEDPQVVARYPEPWVDTNTTAHHLGVSTRTVRRLYKGGMPGCQVGRQLRFRLGAVDRHLQSNSTR